MRPKRVGGSQKWRPSAEFVEGFLIFFYGSTNIFLEHLGNAGEAFSPQDLEHISITVLFIGGGAVSCDLNIAYHPAGTPLTCWIIASDASRVDARSRTAQHDRDGGDPFAP